MADKRGTKSPTLARWKRNIIAAAFWALVWQLASMLVNSEMVLPAPASVLLRFVSLAGTPLFWQSAALTLARIAAGFSIAAALGFALAFLTHRSALAEALIVPALKTVSTTPISSIILLTILWFARAIVPVFISFLMVLPMIWGSVSDALKRVDVQLMEMASAYKLSRGKVLRSIEIPSVLPSFLTACRSGIGFAWKAGISAEVLCSPRFSIGKQLYESKLYVETTDLFAWTLLIILLSLLLEKLLVKSVFNASRARRKRAGEAK